MLLDQPPQQQACAELPTSITPGDDAWCEGTDVGRRDHAEDLRVDTSLMNLVYHNMSVRLQGLGVGGDESY